MAVCKDCGVEFELEEGEKKFFEERKLPLPKRCKRCRKNRKENYSKHIAELKENGETVDTAVTPNFKKNLNFKTPKKEKKFEKKFPKDNVIGEVAGDKTVIGKEEPIPLYPKIPKEEEK